MGDKNCVKAILISIHSLTRRLTEQKITPPSMKSISIHSLTRRLTRAHLLLGKFQKYFNSQPHKEADVQLVPVGE